MTAAVPPRTPVPIPDDLLERLPEEAARLVALGYLAQAGVARGRLGVVDDAEALHDFRVALRRLRSWIRAFGRELDDGVSRKLRRRLRRVARATGDARDAEVQLTWVDAQLPPLRSRQRAGAAWLRARIAARLADASRELRREVTRDFDTLDPKLAKALRRYEMVVDVGAPPSARTFAGAVGDRLRETTAALGARLAAVSPDVPAHPAHEARIAAKRVRYVLEPVAARVDGGPALVSRLKKLQDLLGELHDLDVMAHTLGTALAEAAAEHARRLGERVLRGEEPDALRPVAATDAGGAEAAASASDGGSDGHALRPRIRRRVAADARTPEGEPAAAAVRPIDPRPGLLALARRVRARREALRELLDADWLGVAGAAFVGELTVVADALATRGAAGVEIERKFLLRELPQVARAYDARVIEQGWLPGERLVERVRRVRDGDGRERYFRTVKVGAGMARTELEEEASAELFAALWPLTCARRVRKRRFAIPDGALTWEIDAFTDRELVLAEVELSRVDQAVELPPWLAEYVVREVTGEGEYVNYNLARPETPPVEAVRR